ncbi:hypothetical protein [Streptomyces sp. NPDC048155]|uniref:hypothetical protein n=1 Tax=Streptomyces sp. NPDC048155 TaxID=3154818 RepID=UPI0033C62EB3
MTERRPYPSDLSDAPWELIEPVLTNWRAERRSRALDIGRPPDERLAQITPDGDIPRGRRIALGCSFGTDPCHTEGR